ncbi:MAG: Lrp/AsnC family transcriptional regulator [Candidatus Marinimicrobia bacterium]|jgi:Lrp/AsnC family leucine-responsive transcriptional regulator|nr:Lrp/AsnC family transcriptional regulator [Candidatus Neomarinimicrobiota bacterium]MBT3617390.1 Lrp/AsnC family transcriptional regulator [Candidatus Neomarinimicrobiota bacterium]MBT3829330.1 Lrp/AsnC family transcriptional regulator [Candidatus Neomarinimicrobiota bacterium]MBT3998288.1 Lrp/AsnC family transcriptional regulator [Candidatus Neomarinimicrobiota bacterium]MBT4281589.1 Lrp/AsnC family transcriptional regulator [Candidatus Neomarinimicrobiota bacterium]
MIDAKDISILSLLQSNSRMTASEIAESVGMSVPAVTERIKKLTEAEIIQKFSAKLDAKKLGFDLSAFIAVVSSSSDHYEDIISESIKNPSVMECHSVTGDGSHLLKVRVKSSTGLEKLLRDIQAWPGVIRTHTSVVMSTYKEGFTLKLS